MSKSDQFFFIKLLRNHTHTHLTYDDEKERERVDYKEEEEEEQKMPPHAMVPKSKEKGIRVRRSSMEKTIFCVLIVIVIWRGIAVSGLFSDSDSSSSMMMGRQNENDDFDIGSGGGFKRSNDEDEETEDYGGDGAEEKKVSDDISGGRSSSSKSNSNSGSKRSSESNSESNPTRGGGGGRGGGKSGGTSSRSNEKRASGGTAARSNSRTQKMEDDIFETLRDDSQPLVTHKRLFIVNKPVNPEDPKDSRTKPVLQHWLESTTGDTNETLIYHFPRSLFEQLPLDEPKFEFKTCAVVGNSGVTLLKEYGEEIDNHDAVIRINMAPIRGFEKYVGKRTTFDVVNSHNVREILQCVRRWRPANEGETKLVLFETASHFARYHLCQPLLKKYGAENAILLNPLFSNRAHSLWIKLKELLEKTKNSQYNRKPMSGFFAVLYALQMCEKVDLYGFDAYTSRKKSYRYHYFDNVQGFTDVHSFDLAIEVFKFIAKKGTKGGLTINV